MGDRIDAAEGLGLDALLAGLEYLRSQDLRRRLSSITCPTLVMHGRNDAVVPWRGGKQLADALPRSTWVEMQHAGHDFPLRSPGAIAEHICQFCDALMPETQTVTPEGS
jgi:pimeloyl-ACP methyl ester carboxylesterase